MPYKQILLARIASNMLVSNKGVFGLTRASYSSGHEELYGNPKPLSFTHSREKAAGRTQVGFFLNGEPSYSVRPDYPYPAIRFQKDEGAVLQLREKEKGDWKKLSMEEKKKLYRASFCSTFSEKFAPNGHWKLILALTLVGCTMTCWFSVWFKHYCCRPLPQSLNNESKEQQLQMMIDTYSEPVNGISSMWDYEKNRWKA